MPLNRGMQITGKQVRGLFVKSFLKKERELAWPEICEPIDTFSKTEYFATLGAPPQLEQVDEDGIGPTTADFAELTYDFTNKLFSSRIEVPNSLAWYDQVRNIPVLMDGMAANAHNFPDRLLMTRLRAGGTTAAFSQYPYSEYFFTASHALGGSAGTQSNLITGNTATTSFTGVTTLAPTVAQQLWNDLNNAITTMESWVDQAGEPVYHNIKSSDLIILCGPLLKRFFDLAFGAEYILQTQNHLKNAVSKVISSNYLPSSGAEAADWYLIHKNAPVRPMLYSRFNFRPDSMIQDKIGAGGEPIVANPASIQLLTTYDNPNDKWVIDNNKNVVRMNLLGEVTYGDWKAIVKVDNAAT